MQVLSQRVFSRQCSKAAITPVLLALQNLHVQHRSFRLSHQYFASQKSEPQTKIQWFRQRDDGSISNTPLDPDKDIIDEDDAEEAAILKKRISQLEKELSHLKGEKSTLIEPLLAEVPEEEQQLIREAIRKDEQENPDPVELEEEEDDALPSQGLPSHEEIILQLDLYGQEAADLKRLYTCIRRVVDDRKSTSTLRKQLWRVYLRCRATLPPFQHLMPDEWWNTLWRSQSSVVADGPDRAEHLCILLEDMVENGRDLTAKQQVAFVESLIAQHRSDDAMRFWRSFELKGEESLRDEYTNSMHQALGLKVYASMGKVDQAYQTARELLNSDQRPRPDTLVPVVVLLISQGDDMNLKRAWSLYLGLRASLGPRMEVSDYDTLSMCFLNSGRSDLALAIFKDLMLTGKESNFSSTELYRISLGVVGQLQSQSIDVTQLSNVSLTALTSLPRNFQNKFFYGSWMKKLIGMGEIDAAAKILDLMHERGVRPDAKHLNGIIGGWSRDGSSTSQQKLEQMGWAMIRARFALVNQRQGKSVSVEANSFETNIPTAVPEDLQEIVCPATVETFSLLLLHYQKRGLHRNVAAIREALDLAQITPNSYFMNHLLFAELHRGDQSKAWAIYSDMASNAHPDLETFAILWDCQKAWLDKASPYRADTLPSPRRFLQDMITWAQRLGRNDRKHTLEAFSKDLYAQILRCFCLSRDLPGAISALYALRHVFGIFPDEDTARVLLMQVARIGTDDSKASRRRRTRAASAHNQASIANMAQTLQMVSEKRNVELRERGIDPGGLDPDQQQKEQLFMITEFLKAILIQQGGEGSSTQEKIDEALEEIPIDGLSIKDPLE